MSEIDINKVIQFITDNGLREYPRDDNAHEYISENNEYEMNIMVCPYRRSTEVRLSIENKVKGRQVKVDLTKSEQHIILANIPLALDNYKKSILGKFFKDDSKSNNDDSSNKNDISDDFDPNDPKQVVERIRNSDDFKQIIDYHLKHGPCIIWGDVGEQVKNMTAKLERENPIDMKALLKKIGFYW